MRSESSDELLTQETSRTSARASNLDGCQCPVSPMPSSSLASRDYLLSSTHPVGRTKAEFFAGLGYTREDWAVLAADLRTLAERTEATATATTAFGTKCEIRGEVVGPNNRRAGIVTAWIILVDEDFPRFVTAYPE